jgi:hypothetical protein
VFVSVTDDPVSNPDQRCARQIVPFFSFFFVSNITAIFIHLVFISSTSSHYLFPIDLTSHAAVFSVSYIPIRFSFFVSGRLSIDPSISKAMLLCL